MRLETEMPHPSPYKNGGVRRHPRYLFSVPVTLGQLLGDGIRTTHGLTLEISEGGMSAVVEGDLRIGEIANVDLPLTAGALSAFAIVRHRTAGRFGFEFLGLRPEERQQISNTSKMLQPQSCMLAGI